LNPAARVTGGYLWQLTFAKTDIKLRSFAKRSVMRANHAERERIAQE
jgi:hypothetical protein